jgi:DNA helicase HerA-like ATPase
MGERARDFTLEYGNVSVSSVGAIQRGVGLLEDQGGSRFFSAPRLDLAEWLKTDENGRGVINILAADKLFNHPLMYSTFLMWMLTGLYDLLPERGDADKPRIVFFFDEAHLLFDDCSGALMGKIEQVVRLIRSKGVGVYFITQSPADIPMSVLGQLGNRIQHALRAYTPLDQKAVRVAAQTFRTNPSFDTEEAITNLKTGEALVSFLDVKGTPAMVERAKILFPLSQIGAVTPEQRADLVKRSRLYGRYDHPVDRESAYELITAATQEAERQKAELEAAAEAERQAALEAKEAARAAKEQEKLEKEKAKKAGSGIGAKVLKSVLTAVLGVAAGAAADAVSSKVTGKKSTSKTSTGSKMVKRATKSATTTVTKELTRSILGNLLK